MAARALNLYFTSDLHAQIFPVDYASGKKQDIGLFECANRFHKDGNTLVIDGGDLLQGSPLGAFCHDELGNAGVLAEVMNSCGYDYITLGNHDFNYGMPYLHSYLDALEARCLCENIIDSSGACAFPHCVHVLENGLRVGLVGLVTDYVNIWERPEHLAGISITPPLEAARRALIALRERCDITVGVYHGGFERDLSTGSILSTSTENVAYQICRELDFDILLTGHQHMSVSGQTLFGTFVVQPSDCGREFIQIQAEIDGDFKTFSSVAYPALGACNPEWLHRFSGIEHGAQRWLDQPVGRLSRAMLPGDPLTMASQGSALADFFNQVQLAASDAQLSATSLANHIAGLPQVVRRRDVLTAYPYTNTLTVLAVTGAILRQAMERSASYFSLAPDGQLEVSQSFLQPKVEHYNYDYYAGVRYEMDISHPVGQRITRLFYQDCPVCDSDSFTICLNSYRASGAGGYECYVGCPVVKEINIEMSDLMLAFFQEHPEVTIEKGCAYRVVGQGVRC